jgi:hypothetical protein
MTGREIIDQMCLIGARTGKDFDEEFQAEFVCSAINRAVSEVNKLFPLTETVGLLHYPRRPVFSKKGITVHKGGEDIVYSASDIKSLAFAISGTGTYRITGEGSAKVIKGSFEDRTSFETVKIVISDELIGYESGVLELTFTGEYSYMIKDVSMYDELDGPFTADVNTDSDFIGYDLKSPKYLSGRFLGFSKRPVRYHSVSLSTPNDYRVEGSVLYLRADKEGEYEIECYKAPEKIDLDNLNFEIEVDFRLHDAIALRAAQYVYAIEDEEVADYCRKEFERVMSLTMVTMPTLDNSFKFRDSRGW